MERKVFLAAPVYNPPQEAAEDKMAGTLVSAGFEVFRAGRDNLDVNPDKRREGLEAADLVVFNLDGLLPPGMMIMVLEGATNQVPIQFPPQIYQPLNAGWRAMGLSGQPVQKQKAIMLPGEAEAAQGAPTGMTVQLQPGIVVAKLGSAAPLNITDPNVLVELGLATYLKKPILCLAAGDVQCGAYVREDTVLLVESFEEYDEAVDRLAKTDNFQETLDTIRDERKNAETEESVEEEAQAEGATD